MSKNQEIECGARPPFGCEKTIRVLSINENFNEGKFNIIYEKNNIESRISITRECMVLLGIINFNKLSEILK